MQSQPPTLIRCVSTDTNLSGGSPPGGRGAPGMQSQPPTLIRCAQPASSGAKGAGKGGTGSGILPSAQETNQ